MRHMNMCEVSPLVYHIICAWEYGYSAKEEPAVGEGTLSKVRSWGQFNDCKVMQCFREETLNSPANTIRI